MSAAGPRPAISGDGLLLGPRGARDRRGDRRLRVGEFRRRPGGLNCRRQHAVLGSQPAGVFDGRPVNGWATVSIAFGLTSEDMSENAVGDLGYHNVRIKSPMYHGDSIRARSEVLSLTDADGRPDCGVMRYRMTAVKPDGSVAVEGEWIVLLRRRSALRDRP